MTYASPKHTNDSSLLRESKGKFITLSGACPQDHTKHRGHFLQVEPFCSIKACYLKDLAWVSSICKNTVYEKTHNLHLMTITFKLIFSTRKKT